VAEEKSNGFSLRSHWQNLKVHGNLGIFFKQEALGGEGDIKMWFKGPVNGRRG